MKENVCARAPVVPACGPGRGEAPRERAATRTGGGCGGVCSPHQGKRGVRAGALRAESRGWKPAHLGGWEGTNWRAN